VRGNALIGAIILLAVVIAAFWLFAGAPGGVYYSATTSDTRVKAYPVLVYFPADGETRAFAVTLEVENLGAEDATYLVKTSEDGTSETLDVRAEGKEKMRVDMGDVSTDVAKYVYRWVKVFRNSEDALVTEVPVHTVIGTAPKAEAQTDSNRTVIGQKFVIADHRSDSFVVYADVDDAAAVSEVNVSVPDSAPITVTSVTYTEQTLNSNKWLKAVVNYRVRDSAIEDRLYTFDYNVGIAYEGNTVETATLPAVFVYGGPEELADRYDSVFAEVENVG